MSNIFVLYHADCSDGLAAAYAVWYKYGEEINYVPVSHGEPFPELKLDENSILYILDFHFSKDIINQLRSKVKSCMIIDHHITSINDLGDIEDFICDITKSACVLTWEYLHPNIEVPKLLLYAQDRDLQLFQYPETKALFEGIRASGYIQDFTYWGDLIKSKESFVKTVEIGFTLLLEQQVKVNNFITNPNKFKIVKLKDKIAAVYNTTVLIEEMAEKLIEYEHYDVDYTIGYHITGKGKIVLSFRSKIGTDIDVETIALSYGGGGHKHSSGATLNLKDSLKFLNTVYT